MIDRILSRYLHGRSESCSRTVVIGSPAFLFHFCPSIAGTLGLQHPAVGLPTAPDRGGGTTVNSAFAALPRKTFRQELYKNTIGKHLSAAHGSNIKLPDKAMEPMPPLSGKLT